MDNTKPCPHCGEEIKAEAIKCKHCFSMLEKENGNTIACPFCGEEIRDGAIKCKHCHSMLPESKTKGIKNAVTNNLNRSALLIFISAVLAFLSMFFKWVDMGIAHQNGFQQWSFIYLLYWIYPTLMATFNYPINRIWGSVCAVIAIASSGLYIASKTIDFFGETVNFAGTGAWLFLFISILLLVGIFIYRPGNHVEPSATPLWQKGWFLGSLTIIVFIFAGLGLLTGEDTSSTESPVEDTLFELPDQEEPLPTESNAPLFFLSTGDTTSFNDWDYKLIDVQYHNSIGDSRPRGVYVVFMIEVKNNATTPRDIGNMFQLEDDAERVYAFDSSASLEHYHTYRTDTWHFEDIGPSFSAIMPIAFDISTEANTLYFYPMNMRDSDYNSTGVFVAETTF